jgi:hypothetical protein
MRSIDGDRALLLEQGQDVLVEREPERQLELGDLAVELRIPLPGAVQSLADRLGDVAES